MPLSPWSADQARSAAGAAQRPPRARREFRGEFLVARGPCGATARALGRLGERRGRHAGECVTCVLDSGTDRSNTGLTRMLIFGMSA